MALFKRGKVQSDNTDVGIVGGVIHWNPKDNDELVWKYPSNRIKKGAKLQVHDSQEAALFINGSCVKVFRGGGEAYTISESANIPLLESVLNFATGGEPVYFAEIWFVNVATARKISWFTDEDSGLKFSANNTIYSGRMFCDCVMKVSDTGVFLQEIVGKITDVNAGTVENFFKSNLTSATVETMLAIYRELGTPFQEFITQRDLLQSKLEVSINSKFLERFGVEASLFAIDRFFSPDLEEFWAAQKENVKLAALGVNYAQERQLDILQTAAGNEGGVAGAMMGAGIGFGAGVNAGNMFSNSGAQQAPPPIPTQVTFYYSHNGTQQGPLDLSQLQLLIQQQVISSTTLVWRAGMAQWSAASSVAELAPLFQASTPPPIPPAL